MKPIKQIPCTNCGVMMPEYRKGMKRKFHTWSCVVEYRRSKESNTPFYKALDHKEEQLKRYLKTLR